MKKKIKPIKPLLKEMKELCKRPTSNSEKIEDLRETIVDQYKSIKKVDQKKLDKLISSSNTSPEQKEKYESLKKEFNDYDRNNELIDRIIKKDYIGVNAIRLKERKRFYIYIATGLLAASITGCILLKPKGSKREEATTAADVVVEVTTEEPYKYTEESRPDEVEHRIIYGNYDGLERRVINGEPTQTRDNNSNTIEGNNSPVESRTIEGDNSPVESRTIEGDNNPVENRTIEGDNNSNNDRIIEGNYDPVESRIIEGSTTSNEGIDVSEQWTLKYLFTELKNEIIELNNSKEAEIVRKKGKEYVVQTIDFIFYGADINGLKFNDLTTEFKESIYDALKGMDEIIMIYEPNYKEALGEKYSIVKDFTKEKLGDAKELIVKKLGKEKYDSIVAKGTNIYERIKESTKEYGGKALDYIKDKYEKWRHK